MRREVDLLIVQKKHELKAIIEGIKQEASHAVIDCLRNPTPLQKRVERAIDHKIERKVIEKCTKVKKIVEEKAIDTAIMPGQCAYGILEKSGRRVLWQLGIANYCDNDGVYRLDKKQNNH